MESRASEKTKSDIPCLGRPEDGRIILFDKKSSLSRIIKPGDKIKDKILVAKPWFVIVEPQQIMDQTVEPTETRKVESKGSTWDSSLIVTTRRGKEKQRSRSNSALKLSGRALSHALILSSSMFST